MISGATGRAKEREPDIAVTLEPTTAYADRHPGPAALHLVVEVSDTTLDFDRNTKARLYARAGVSEYWVADVPSRQLHCYRGPTRTGYSEVKVHSEGESVSVLSFPDATGRFGDLLAPVNTAQ